MKPGERIDGAGPMNFFAQRYELLPPAQRQNPDSFFALDCWILHLPGYAIWPHYLLSGTGLADIPGRRPATKQFPEATHEVLVAAIDPDCTQADWLDQRIQTLSPINYVRQMVTTETVANALLRHLAERFVSGFLPPEPQGIVGARELFNDTVDQFLQKV